MAILATLFAAAGRFLGRVLSMALGWATMPAIADARSPGPSVTERAVETAVGAGFAVAGSLLDRILAAGPLSRLPGAATRRRAVERQSGEHAPGTTSLGGGRATEAHP
jgi:hypothetical protein